MNYSNVSGFRLTGFSGRSRPRSAMAGLLTASLFLVAAGASDALAVDVAEALATDGPDAEQSAKVTPVSCPRCGGRHYQAQSCPGAARPASPPAIVTPPGQSPLADANQMPGSGPANVVPPVAGGGGNQPSANNMASSLGAASAPQSAAPFMIGDQFGGSIGISTIQLPDYLNTNAAQMVPVTAVPASAVLHPSNPGTYPLIFDAPATTFHGSALPSTTITQIGMTPVNTSNQTIPINAGTAAYQVALQQAVLAYEGHPGVATVQPQGTAVSTYQYSVNPADSYYYTLTENVTYTPYQVPAPIRVNILDPGANIGMTKIAENTSPMPRDRVFFNYSYFSGVPLSTTGVDVNRFTPGFEKTFLNRRASVEMRLPFAATLDNSNIVANGTTNFNQLEFGNISIALKALIYRSDAFAMSGGLQVTAPTASGTNVYLMDGTPLVAIHNHSTHLMPFLGALYTPNDRLFAQGFLQVDVDANGNPVYVNNFAGMNQLGQIGTAREATFMYIDLGLGYWVYRNRPGYLTGFAPTIEVHKNQSLAGSHAVVSSDFQIGTSNGNVGSTNLVLGSTFQLGPLSSLTAGYTVPVENGPDRQFNGELRVFFNRRFGSQSRLTRAQF